MPTFRITLFHIHRSLNMGQCSEMWSYKIRAPGNHPKVRIQHSEHGWLDVIIFYSTCILIINLCWCFLTLYISLNLACRLGSRSLKCWLSDPSVEKFTAPDLRGAASFFHSFRTWLHVNKCWVTITEGLKSARFEPVTAMLVCCQVEVSATSWALVQRSPTDCAASLCVI
jgi:hypothetical protein